MSAIDQDFVRDLIERHSDASGGNGRDFHNGAYAAIADELNAMFGSCNCSNDCTNGERTDVPRLPHFWTHDGTLHIEATRMPTRIVVCEGGTCEFVPKRELDASEAENAKLQNENARLRSCLSDDAENARMIMAENAKLRELVRDMHAVISDRNSWWDCMYKDTRRFADRMRELGVEVDA